MSVIYNALKKIQGDKDLSKRDLIVKKEHFYEGFFYTFPSSRHFYLLLVASLSAFIGYGVIYLSSQHLDLTMLFTRSVGVVTGLPDEWRTAKKYIRIEDEQKTKQNIKGEEKPEVIFYMNHNLRGIQYYEGLEFSSAISEFEKAISLNPDYPEPYNNLGIVFRKRGDLEKSLEYYEKALNLRSNYPEALNNSGVVLNEMGRLKEAKSRFQKAIELHPSYPDPYLNLALSLDSSGRAIEALRFYDAFLLRYEGLDKGLLMKLRERVLQIKSLSLNVFDVGM